MMFEFKGIKVFYRHFFYGSAITLASMISCITSPPIGWFHIAMLTAGAILMGISFMITYAINKYPEDFKDML